MVIALVGDNVVDGAQSFYMYALRNKVQLIGHLGSSPEIKSAGNGKKLAVFTLTTSETYRNSHGKRITATQWHRVIAWGRLADMADKFLYKGKEVAIEGKLINRMYTDKLGSKHCITEVQLSELLMLGGNNEE